MNGITAAAVEIQTILEDLEFEFCIIGGLAVVYWGNPRATQDVDVSLLVPLGQEPQVASRLLQRVRARIADAESFAVESRVLLARASNGTPLDIAFAAFPLEQAAIARSRKCELQPGVPLRMISAEDLVVTKAIAARPQDGLDIRGILDRQGNRLDREQIRRELADFCQLLETDEPLQFFNELAADS